MSDGNGDCVELDAAMLQCPLPLLKTKLALKGLPAGGLLQVKTTDSASVVDIPRFIDRSGHTLVSIEQRDEYALITIKKG